MVEGGTTAELVAESIGCHRNTVLDWIKNEKWEKGKKTKEILQTVRKSTAELAEDLGLTRERVVEKIKEFQEAQKPVFHEDREGQVDAIDVPDYNTQIKGNQQAMDVLDIGKKADVVVESLHPIVIETTDGKEIRFDTERKTHKAP